MSEIKKKELNEKPNDGEKKKEKKQTFRDFKQKHEPVIQKRI